MFQSISRGWTLTKASFRVLKLDKEIIALPLMSGLAMILAGAVMFGGFIVTIPALNDPGPILYAGIFLWYVVMYFIAIFFNAAVIECAMIRFQGGDPVVSDGLRKAGQRVGKIFQWALVAATVGLILKILENAARSSDHPVTRIIGQIAVAIAGAAWNIATFFAVPVLVYDNVGPGQAMKGSVGTMKKVFGEGVAGIFTTGIVFLLLGLLAIIPGYLGIMLMGTSVIGGITLLAIAALYLIVVFAANSAIDGILKAALYKYSLDGKLPDAFDGTGALDVRAREQVSQYA